MSGDPHGRWTRSYQRVADVLQQRADILTPPSPYADHIRRLVESAPPLTADQRDRLTVLLRGTA